MTETSQFPGSQHGGSRYDASQYGASQYGASQYGGGERGDARGDGEYLDPLYPGAGENGGEYPLDDSAGGQYPGSPYSAPTQGGAPYSTSEATGGDHYDDTGPADERPELIELIDELISMVERAKSMPLSSSAIISRDEVLGLLAAARDALPVELRNARRLLQDHEELRQRAEREAAEVLDEARSQAQYMVQRTEVVRQARHQAERIVEEAEADSRRVRHEADDYVDRKLASFEIVLDRTMRTVRAGRERLAVVPGPLVEDDLAGAGGADDAFFDQDQS
ncbi:MAG TPA: hypothetical protein VMD59_17430 [Acidimicrobiales bacterium]|nr:hypothetical protein [Acidimicrobiales bacterium]